MGVSRALIFVFFLFCFVGVYLSDDTVSCPVDVSA